MGYACRVVEDSSFSNSRVTTIEVTFPRIVLAEKNTHRVLSKNSASSRAIPVKKRIQAVLDDPFVPAAFGANKSGMASSEWLDDEESVTARDIWMAAMAHAVDCASQMEKLGVHKQWANRLLEPFSWQTVIVTATEWENFFNLRISEHAQPEIRTAAEMMKKAREESTPRQLKHGGWHLPYVRDDERHLSIEDLVKISSARCARVSYLTHDGVRDISADLNLYDRLVGPGHMSPLEHPAQARPDVYNLHPSNFCYPWVQHRKFIPGEAIFRG